MKLSMITKDTVIDEHKTLPRKVRLLNTLDSDLAYKLRKIRSFALVIPQTLL